MDVRVIERRACFYDERIISALSFICSAKVLNGMHNILEICSVFTSFSSVCLLACSIARVTAASPQLAIFFVQCIDYVVRRLYIVAITRKKSSNL